MAWRAAEFVYVHLRTCHRIGASEREFVQLMGRIRRGEARDKVQIPLKLGYAVTTRVEINQ